MAIELAAKADICSHRALRMFIRRTEPRRVEKQHRTCVHALTLSFSGPCNPFTNGAHFAANGAASPATLVLLKSRNCDALISQSDNRKIKGTAVALVGWSACARSMLDWAEDEPRFATPTFSVDQCAACSDGACGVRRG